MLRLQDNINQGLLMFFLFWSFHHVVWPWPGCLILMPAREPSLNLDYAKNEADRGSRHHSLVSYPVKTISSSYSVCLSFYDSPPFLLFHELYSTQLHFPSSLRAPVFVFPLRVCWILFLTLSDQGAGRWNLFYGTETALWYLQWCLWVGIRESNLLNLHSQCLLTCLWRCHKSLLRLPANFGLFIALLL